MAEAVAALPSGRYLLAVSGGRDSMALLDAFARWRRDAVGVATFDHGTGESAAEAVLLVQNEAAARRLSVESGRMMKVPGAPSEAGWRAARWGFLHEWARALDATVATAHTQDDQLETVVMRALRGAGARGLAAMYAPSSVARPLLGVTRAAVTRYALNRRLTFVDDPSNESLRFLRNRVRRQLLPALERSVPGFGEQMLALSRRAARWRASVESLVDSLGLAHMSPRAVVVPIAAVEQFGAPELAVVWPVIAARAGVNLDWRGTDRLVAFTMRCRSGARMPLSGGAQVRRTATTFVFEGSAAADALYFHG